MGSKIGVMEFVKNCATSGRYNWKNLDSKNPAGLSAEDKMEFLRSMAGRTFFKMKFLDFSRFGIISFCSVDYLCSSQEVMLVHGFWEYEIDIKTT